MVPSLKIFNAGPAPLISALFDALGIGRILDSVLPWDETQCKLPPSVRIKALVINILAGRTPLYNVERFFQFRDLDNLLGQGVTYEDLNDDCLARALDIMLAEANPKKVCSTIMLNALSVESIALTMLTQPLSLYMGNTGTMRERKSLTHLSASLGDTARTIVQTSSSSKWE